MAATISFPIRREGFRVLSALPAEIYIEILEQLLHYCSSDPLKSKHLAQLALTCQYFRIIVLPHQFGSLEFICDNTKGTWKTRNTHEPWAPPKSAQFLGAINGGDVHALALAPYVKACTFRAWELNRNYIPSDAKLKCLVECLSALPSLPNLEALYFPENTRLPGQSMPFIGKLRGLKTLHLTHFFDEDLVDHEDLLRGLRFLRLKELSATGGHEQTLICRYLRTRNLKVLRTANWSFVKHIFSLRPTIQLQELDIQCPLYNPEKLWRYLALTPSITHLTLTHLEFDFAYGRDRIDLSHVRHPPTFLPNLQVLNCGTPTLAATFAAVSMKQLSFDTNHLLWESMDNFSNRITEIFRGTVFTCVENLTIRPASAKLPEAVLKSSFPRLEQVRAAGIR